MQTMTKPLLSLAAVDVMTEAVLMIPAAMSLRQAAHMLRQARITGAPVVDATGRCAGVISATDFVHWAEKGEGAAKKPAEWSRSVHTAWEILSGEDLPREEVGQYMTPDPVTVSPATPIGELARMMVDAHIHRLVVVDPAGRPVGIVASTDLLAAMARADQRLPKKG